MNTPEKHLSLEDIERLREDGGPHGSSWRAEEWDHAQSHLATCEFCQRLMRMYDSIQQGLSKLSVSGSTGGGENCSSREEWASLLANLLPEARARELLEHCSGCDACSLRLRSLTEDFSAELTEADRADLAGLESSKPEWQSTMARQMKLAADLARGKEKTIVQVPQRSRLQWARWAYACAAVLVLLVGAGIYRKFQRVSVDRLVAQAYTEQRTLELRIQGSDYAPLKQQRGSDRSSLAKPASLLKAEYLIKEQLVSKPEDEALLGSKGKAELVEWQYDEAIRSLRHALDLQPDSPSLLCDLATAFAERGELESRPLDYGQALEYLGQALSKKPNDPVFLFNRALVEERLMLFEEAARDWEHYLQIDHTGGWANEAQEHLNVIRQRKKGNSAAPSAETDPARATRVLEARNSRESADRTAWPDSLDEDYLEIAVEKWLPALAAHSGRSDIRNLPEWRVLSELAAILMSKHGDTWLADVLSAPATSLAGRGWQELGKATSFNEAGDFDRAAPAAERAEGLLTAGKSPAGVARALWEEAYALQRQQRGDRCLIADERAKKLNVKTYPWITVQLDLEYSICSAMVGRPGAAGLLAEQAVARAEAAGYATLLLRALQIAGTQVASEDSERSWTWLARGLQHHWAGAYRPFRAYQFYAEMSLTAESREQWFLARSLMSEAATHIGRTSNHLTEAVALHSLAVDTQMTGDLQDASEQFRRAEQLFSSLPRSATTRTFLFSARVYEASLEAEEGQTALALQVLSDARSNYSEESQYWVWLHYYEAIGDTLLQRGSLDDAERALRAAVSISEHTLSTLRTDADRLLWEKRTSRAYRSLVELEIEKKRDPEKVLELWEWYLSGPVRLSGRISHPQGINFAALETRAAMPSMSVVKNAIPQLGDVTLLSFAELKTGLLVWIVNRAGVRWTPLQVSPPNLELTIRRFVRLCADSSSDINEVRRTGRQLYDWLFAPLDEWLASSSLLLIEFDEGLQALPVEALVNSKGEFLGHRYDLVIGPGLEFEQHLRKTSAFSSRDKALVVGTSASLAPFGLRLDPLDDAEVEARGVSSHFSYPTLLAGKEATLDAVQRELPLVRVFHFAGHGITSATRSGLLLAPSGEVVGTDGAGKNFLDAALARKLRFPGVDLVVLSACATAGESGGLADPQSLARVFLRAGVPQVVATRWSVDSRSTSALMQEFYTRLNGGLRPAAALRTAADVVRGRPETAHPFYWAAFSVFGRD